MKKILLILLICISTVLVSSPTYAYIEYDDEYYEYFDDEDYGAALYKLFILKDNEPVDVITIMEKTTQKLTVRPYPTKANANVRWHSSDGTVATVDNNGVVTAVGIGTCKIYAISKISSAKKDVVTVNVTRYTCKADRITIAPEEGAVFETGKTVALIPTFYPEETTEKALRWYAFGTAATIDQNGVLTLKEKGTVKVKAVTFDWSQEYDMEIDIKYAENHFAEIGKAYNVKNTKAVVIEFDNDISANSAYSSIFATNDAFGNGDLIDVDIGVNGNILTVKPKTVWSDGECYIFIKDSLKDKDGNTIGGNYKYMLHVRKG
ncbi:MAG: Ig-like domain-containing protein [Eubacteriales bacterium]|nr:Ig-like domain-containing protein [Eubacteriales bacterium]